MTAIRLARGFTRRDKIIKFEGCYHGHADALLVKAGSGALTFGQPSSAGVPPEVVAHTLVLDFNDIEGVARAFEREGKDIAAVIVEPVAGNMNLIAPRPEFIQGLRELCTTSRRGADLRRSDDRVSRRAARCAGSVRHQAGPDHAGKSGRRRHAAGRVRRPARHHAVHRAARPGVSGWNAVGKSGSGRRWPGDAATGASARISSTALPPLPRLWSKSCRRRAHGRRDLFGAVGRWDVRDLFCRTAAAVLCGGDAVRPGGVQSLLPRHAGGRRLSRAVSVRGGVRFRRAYAVRYRATVSAAGRVFEQLNARRET